MQFAGTAQMMAGKGIPLVKLALLLSILIELGGGLALLFGLCRASDGSVAGACYFDIP